MQLEREPRPGLGRHHGRPADARTLARDIPLGEEHGVLPAVMVEQTAQDRGGQVERNVPHDDGSVQGFVQGVGDVDGCRGQTRSQPRRAARIDVDRTHIAAEPDEVRGERAVAGSELEDGPLRRGDEAGDALQGRTVGEEVLAEFMPAAGVGMRSHGALRSQEGSTRERACEGTANALPGAGHPGTTRGGVKGCGRQRAVRRGGRGR